MATGERPSTPPPVDPVTLLTECPQCRRTICRSCVYDVLYKLGLGAADLSCGQHLDLPSLESLTISQRNQQKGLEDGMEDLKAELEKRSCIPCQKCSEKGASSICFDCLECYCDDCSAVHQKSSDTGDHVLQFLPQAHQQALSVSPATLGPKSPADIPESSQDSVPDQPVPRSCDKEVQGELGDAAVEWNEWVEKEMDLLQQASKEQKKVKTALQDVLALGQKLLDREQSHQQIIDLYQQHLPDFDVVGCKDPSTYILNVQGSDVNMEVKMETLEERICRVMKSDQQTNILNAVEMIKTQLSQLSHRS